MATADPRNFVPPGRSAPFFAFVAVVLAVAALTSAAPLLALPDQVFRLPAAFWTMAVLAVAGDAWPFVPAGRRRSSVMFPSICFTFAILLGWGLGPAVAVQAVAVVVSGVRMGHASWRIAFNAGQYACALAAAHVLIGLGPGDLVGGGQLSGTDVVAVSGAMLAWFTVNYGLVSTAVWLRFGARWRPGMGFELLSTGSLLLLAPVLITAAQASAALVPLVLAPLFAVYQMARLSAEQQQLASLDPLTGLPNRNALVAEVGARLHRHAERAADGSAPARMALLLLDLDRFKHVNDALGHAVGDRLLVEVGARLTEVADGDLVARLGGDEFAIVLTGLTDVAEARDRAGRVVAALAEPVTLDGLPLDVGGSIGVALFPDHGEDFTTLMRHADVAMYDAKQRNDTVAVYVAESDHNSAERLGLLADLRRVLASGLRPDADGGGADPGRNGSARPVLGGADAVLPGTSGSSPGRWSRWGRRQRVHLVHSDELIQRIVTAADPIRRRAIVGPAGLPASGETVEPLAAATDGAGGPELTAAVGCAGGLADPAGAGEITMYYQPQVAIATGEVVGVEALLRWRHPRRGMVDPEELIRVAEQSAVMRLLTLRVIDDVVAQLGRWQAAGVVLRAALNVSVRDLHTGEIADRIAERLAQHDVPPQRLQLEITEGALMADPRRVLATITRLHRLGVGIALDDFGTGFSSLQHLRRLPLTEVKVDRSFVLGMTEDADDAAIVTSVVELARALGLRAVAEGVEDERTWRMLHAIGCDAAQGWFYARPMPAEELVAWLARHRPVRPTPGPEAAVGPHPAR
ncbi:putative bifunctional diguanylate cyclase/phosphodiesterase [Salinispora pacifica]|uniref:putative bifunctional diguanylate cyclase/phosphodiesterase n=1 Tax=Salinispora pacifica TaxID=351187 RepID=UPI00047F387E|nr:bifunctional diguanylate cyclase/phosphodiesterase [Salinispora pacifica]